MWKTLGRLSVVVVVWTGAGCRVCDRDSLAVVDFVDVERYMGTWYEIARYPNSFEAEDCVGVTAEYVLREDGKVRVVNTCHRGARGGRIERATGVARIVDRATNAKLKVTFFWPFAGDYWIIGLDEEYGWAVVGDPCRRYLWILSRTPALARETYERILADLPALGYSPERLIETPQAGG